MQSIMSSSRYHNANVYHKRRDWEHKLHNLIANEQHYDMNKLFSRILWNINIAHIKAANIKHHEGIRRLVYTDLE